jgi:hypothetical protein
MKRDTRLEKSVGCEQDTSEVGYDYAGYKQLSRDLRTKALLILYPALEAPCVTIRWCAS